MARADNKQIILDYLGQHPGSSSSEILAGISHVIAIATIKRALSKLVEKGIVEVAGKGKNTVYQVRLNYQLLGPVDIRKYFVNEIDERHIVGFYNPDLIRNVLPTISLFTDEELLFLNNLQSTFKKNISTKTQAQYDKEMQRLAIDLSWKSSQIEGNTYSLLETERLLNDKETAAGKPLSDAQMLLNHKEAINFILQQKDYLHPIKRQAIEDIHSILMKDLGVQRNLRTSRVGVTGTNYRPLDNEHQIKEAIEDMCALINKKENVFEKALLCLLLLSYIQGFEDGNKRTARIVSNALLLANGYCPLSFRTVDAIEYKESMLVFYEKNNLSAVKDIFMKQYEFAVKTYF